MIELLDAAADLLEEQRMLRGIDEAYKHHGAEIRAESQTWERTLSDGPPV